ncbi:hypothetical protein K3Z80_02780 [Pseudomonas aeruginosa]|uniref:hypothetical protein n=1 Tax=Pseudomonas paraeruginosa TaxID=2994495 RepID=UPI0039FC4BE9|nr:hypothetical protein [Pseudomonas aeruginosa]
MRYLRYLAIALASSLLTAYAVLWFIAPATAESPHTVVRPPLKVDHQDGQLLIWGGWETETGYDAPGTNAVEIRCFQTTARCTEAYASILHHTEGEDLEAQVFDYAVKTWTDSQIQAVAEHAMDCLDRRILVDLATGQARLEWSPGSEAGCDGDTGSAVLVGDPL